MPEIRMKTCRSDGYEEIAYNESKEAEWEKGSLGLSSRPDRLGNAQGARK